MLAQARHESDLFCDTTIAQKYDTSMHQKSEFIIQMQNTINKLDEKHQKSEFIIQMQNTINKLDEKLGTDWKSN